jgi:hypothetical protein
MKALTQVTGRVAVLDRADMSVSDTALVPERESEASTVSDTVLNASSAAP